MSKKTNALSRRHFLKGAAYTSALSLGGLSSFALAANVDTASFNDALSTSGDITNNSISVMQQHMLHKEMVSLFNNSDEVLMLDAAHPVKIERVNGSLVVKPNISKSKSSNNIIMMQARQRISFDIQTTGSIFSHAEIKSSGRTKGKFLHINSEHSGFNALIPVSNSAFRKTMPSMA